MDSLDDIFDDGETRNARAVGKFQPKAKLPKPRPRKQSAAPVVPSTQCQSSLEKQDGKIAEGCVEKLPEKNGDSLLAVQPSGGKNICEVMNPSTEYPASAGGVESSILDLRSDIVFSTSAGDWNPCFAKSARDNADIFLGFESLDDFLSQPSTTIAGNEISRSPSRVEMGSQLDGNFSTSYAGREEVENSITHSEIPASMTFDTSTEEALSIPVVSSVHNSAWLSDTPQASMPSNATEIDYSICYQEADTFSNNNGDFQIGNSSLGTEFQEEGHFSSLEILDIASSLSNASSIRQKTGKFQPKPKVQNHNEDCVGISNLDTQKFASFSSEDHAISSATEYMDDVLIPACPSADANGFSCNDITMLVSEHEANEGMKDFSELSHSDATILNNHLGVVSEVSENVTAHQNLNASKRAKNCKRKASTDCSVFSEVQNMSTSGQENFPSRVLRPRGNKTNTYQLFEEPEEGEGVDNGGLMSGSSGSFVIEENIDDDDFQVEEVSKTEKLQKKPNKPATQKQKRVKKPKNAENGPDQLPKEPRKKFSHSSRQKRRRVDKSLLEMPDYEIDYGKLPIRDLILLAEHKERISVSNKTETTTEAPLTNQSTFPSRFHEDETFASEQDQLSNDEQTERMLEESLTNFNYHSYMDKEARCKWTMQDTELFYKAVRQFGSDFSMIQQLFPGRTRRQVKLKFKKEERQHPLRFQEALCNRAKDHTHFQLVIEHLQQIAAEEKQKSNLNDPIDLTVGDNVTPEANENGMKFEEKDEMMSEVLEPEVTTFPTPEKLEDSEDDEYRWSNYKSEL